MIYSLLTQASLDDCILAGDYDSKEMQKGNGKTDLIEVQ